MITKEYLKKEIDNVSDEYLEILLKIIKAFEDSPEMESDFSKSNKNYNKEEWLSFVNETYGCLSEDPIKRGEQGNYEIRESLQ